jgi:hypothetical protein
VFVDISAVRELGGVPPSILAVYPWITVAKSRGKWRILQGCRELAGVSFDLDAGLIVGATTSLSQLHAALLANALASESCVCPSL